MPAAEISLATPTNSICKMRRPINNTIGEKSIIPVSGIILRIGFKKGSNMTESACQMAATMLFDRLTTLNEISKLRIRRLKTSEDADKEKRGKIGGRQDS